MDATITFSQRDIKDEIANTYSIIIEKAYGMEGGTINAYLSLLYNLISLIEDGYERREWCGKLMQLKIRFESTLRLF